MRALPLFLPVLLISSVGCGLSYDTSEVSGTVTHRGDPLEGVSVNFTPIDSELGMGSFAKTDNSGKYQLKLIETDRKGAAVGEHRVTITIPTEENNDSIDPSAKRLPQRYRDGSLTFAVPADGTESADFAIE